MLNELRCTLNVRRSVLNELRGKRCHPEAAAGAERRRTPKDLSRDGSGWNRALEIVHRASPAQDDRPGGATFNIEH